MKNYLAFVGWHREKSGMTIERFAPGSNGQVALVRAPKKYPDFEFRNVGANGEVWTGVGTVTRSQFPDLATVPRADWPTENMCSTSFRLSYGKFDYFNGADIPGIPADGFPLWHDVETPVAKAVGPVEAAILNHHGYVDTMNAFFVATLRPRVWTISVWDSPHPTIGAWNRIQSARLYPGPRDVFATDSHAANRISNGLVFVDTTTGQPITDTMPDSELAAVRIGDGAVTDRSGVFRGWLVVNGSLAMSGDFQMEGFAYVADRLSQRGGARILGGVMAGHIRDASASLIESRPATGPAVAWSCDHARTGGGEIPQRWLVQPGSYRETAG